MRPRLVFFSKHQADIKVYIPDVLFLEQGILTCFKLSAFTNISFYVGTKLGQTDGQYVRKWTWVQAHSHYHTIHAHTHPPHTTYAQETWQPTNFQWTRYDFNSFPPWSSLGKYFDHVKKTQYSHWKLQKFVLIKLGPKKEYVLFEGVVNYNKYFIFL